MAASRPIHFDMTAEDPERMVTFYSTVFGWTFQKWDGPMDYWMATTGPEGTPGIDGGVGRREPGKPAETVNTMGVESVDKAIEEIKAAGGTITMEKHEIPGVGYLALALDTEGNQFGVIQRTHAGS